MIYIVTQDVDATGKEKNICVTDDPDEAKRVCDEEYYEEERGGIGRPMKYHTFIQVWELGAEEPEFVTRSHPEELSR
jgi:hypothetical protein